MVRHGNSVKQISISDRTSAIFNHLWSMKLVKCSTFELCATIYHPNSRIRYKVAAELAL